MFSHNQILINPKSYGLVHNVSKKYVFAVWCLQMHWFKSTAVLSFNQPFTLKQDFVLEGWDILCLSLLLLLLLLSLF